MKKQFFIVLLLALLIAPFLGGCSKPEDKIASHIEAMAEIMEDNADSPEDGVKKLESYLQDNGPTIARHVGEMIVELDKIDDDAEAKERLKEMKDTLETVSKKFEETSSKFQAAVGKDKAATEYVMKVTLGRFMPLAEVLPKEIQGMGGMLR